MKLLYQKYSQPFQIKKNFIPKQMFGKFIKILLNLLEGFIVLFLKLLKI